MSRGSLCETDYLLNLSFKLGYLKSNEFELLDGKRKEVAKTLFGLIESVKKEV